MRRKGEGEMVAASELRPGRPTPAAGMGTRGGESHFQALWGRASVAVYLVDSDLRVREVNARAAAAFHGMGEVMGRDIDELIHLAWPSPKADEMARQFRHTLQTGESHVAPELIEHRSDRGALEFYEWEIHRIPMPDGTPGVICYFNDISSHVRTRRTSRENQERFCALVSATSHLLFRMNPDWTEMRMVSVGDPSNSVGEPVRDWLETLVHPEDQERVLAAVQQAKESGTAFTIEHRVRRSDGSVDWSLVRAVPIRDEQGEITEWFGAAADITERRRSEVNAAFLAEIQEGFSRLSDSETIMALVGEKLLRHLGVSRVGCREVDLDSGRAMELHGRRDPDLTPVPPTIEMAEFMEPEGMKELALGRVVAINDVATDPRTRAFASRHEALDARSHLFAPYISGGRWKMVLSVHHRRPHVWRPDEIELVRELASRLYLRLERAEAERALRASEERYRTLFNRMDEGFCVLEVICDGMQRPVDLLCLEANPAVAKHTGIDAVGRKALDLLGTVDPDWLDTYGRVAITGQPQRVERYFALADRWFSVYAFKLGGRDSRKVAVLFSDITHRRRTEDALRKSEERLRKALSIETVGVIYFKTDGIITDANDAFLRMSGYDRADLQIGEVRWDRQTPPEWMPRSLKAVEEFITHGRTAPYEKEYIRKDGSRWWALFAATRISDDEGVEFVIDITDRKQTMAALQNSEERYRSLFNSIDEGFCVIEVLFDEEGRPTDYVFIEVNPAFEAQSGMHGVEGRRMRELVPGHESHWFEIYGRVAETGEPVRFVDEARALDRWFDVFAFRLGAPDSHRVAVLFNDISEYRRAEQALRQQQKELETALDAAKTADRAKNQFLATLSHELRTPLNPVLMLASEALGDPGLSPEIRETFEIIRRNVELEARLIDDLLDLTRITHGNITVKKQVLDLRKVLRNAIDNARGDVVEKQLQINVLLPDEPVWVEADPVRLQQVFWNLLSNAVKFTPADGTVTVQLQGGLSDGMAQVEVTDTGAGMTPRELERVFEPFVQGNHAHEPSRPRFGGLGLGLAIARRLVELHGGRIEAASAGEGRGSTFKVLLSPATGMKAANPPAPPSVPEARSAGMSLRILVVEDHASTRVALTALLKRRGHVVRMASMVNEAVDALGEEPFDVLVSDIGLPDGSGYDILERASPQSPHMVSVALSGFGMEQDLRRSAAAGFSDHLVKPIAVDQLDELLGRIVETRAGSTVGDPPNR